MTLGRPPKYKTPEEMQVVIDEYFDGLDGEIATMAGLALELDMTTQALRDYAKKDAFLCTVKKARQRVENAWERHLTKGGAGPIFWLKNNAGWKDKKEHDVSGNLNVTAVERTVVQADDSNG